VLCVVIAIQSLPLNSPNSDVRIWEIECSNMELIFESDSGF
jgi:hypothetical protein